MYSSCIRITDIICCVGIVGIVVNFYLITYYS